MSGRGIRIFLVDGTPTGLRTAEIGLSTIKGVLVPRDGLALFSRRDEAEKTGVYVLVGEDEDIPGRLKIYVGEGDKVIRRILKHDQDPSKEYWDRVVVFVSKDDNLTKAHVRHLESRLVEQAKQARRCTVDNSQTPNGGSLPEMDEAEMEEFLAQVRILLATLGVNAFEPEAVGSCATGRDSAGSSLKLFLSGGEGYDAQCVFRDGEFTVLKGSIARGHEAPSLGRSSRASRAELLSSGVLKQTSEGLEFTQDYTFSSASGAAQLIVGANVNGRAAWKLEDGSSLNDWQRGQLPPEVVVAEAEA